VSLVGEDIFGGHAFDQVTGRGPVVLLSEPHRQAERVCANVELGSEAAARTAKRLASWPPFLAAPRRLRHGLG
jgi:hypothetical protein